MYTKNVVICYYYLTTDGYLEIILWIFPSRDLRFKDLRNGVGRKVDYNRS